MLWLPLSDTRVSDIKAISGLTILQALHLAGRKVANEQIEELKKALPELNIRS